ncbi:MAG TPA: response regulator transcription factor [Candidatus Eisenbacteria bacterium]|nr:response regulator transcription factor [Candidatus Eisenbacteria bacterium]
MNVVVIEDDARYRDSLAALFGHTPGFQLVGCFAAATEALRGLGAGERPAWDLVLMDVDLPGMNGIEATRAVKRLLPSALVVVLTVFEEPNVILEAICAGADGYLLKKTPAGELVSQLRVVAAGGAPLTAGVARTVLQLVRDPAAATPEPRANGHAMLQLTDRERDVLRGLTQGLAYKQVADVLGVSLDTVRTHVRNIYRKLQVHSVAEAVSRALRHRLI